MIQKIIPLILVACAVSLSACATKSPATVEIPTQNKDYILGVGDTVSITVYGHEDLTGDFTVEPNGMISFPLVQDVSASGYTARELEETLTQSLSPEYLVDARVSVDIAAFRNVYVLGEVNTPGKYEYIPNMTLLQAVATAGGYTYRAEENRAEVTRHVKGALKTFSIDDKTMIKPGDTVVIGRRWF